MVSDQTLAAISLPPVLDLQAADPLRAELLSLRGRPLQVDASQVNRLGGLCLQVLMSARKLWAEGGFSRFTRGLSASMLRAVPANAAARVWIPASGPAAVTEGGQPAAALEEAAPKGFAAGQRYDERRMTIEVAGDGGGDPWAHHRRVELGDEEGGGREM